MAEPTIQLGGGNWAGKSGNLLGYYEQNKKFYAEDFTFSRSTTGTYTDKEGYIQEMPYNLATYSESFGSGTFFGAPTNLTVINNNAVAPNGTITAAKLTSTADGARLSTANLVPSTLSASTTYTFSVYVKNINASNYYVRTVSATPSNDVEYTISTTEWTRIEHTFTTSASATYIRLVSSLAEGESILVWGAQVNSGSSAKTYFPTTTRLNMPRVDYFNNSNGSLILEPQRSNLLNYSTDFSQWTLISTVIDTNAVSPTSESNATTITDNGSGGASGNVRIQATNFTITASTQYTFSAYVKANPNSEIKVTTRNDDALRGGTFDISTLTFTPEQGTENGSVESFGNGFYRIITTWTSGSDTSIGIGIGFPNITRDGTNSFILWGTQVEQGSYPTTLINTSGSSVTRNADVCTDGGDVSRFNSSEGVLYAEIASLEETSSSSKYISISDETYNNRLSILFSSGATNQIRAFLRVGGVSQVDFNGSVTDVTDYNKVAFKYKDNDFSLWINGVEVATDTSGSTFSANTLTKLSFSEINTTSGKFEGKVKDLKVYNTALSDSELITLTTL